mmetsp:Transcript_47434/g.92570  ORF Transcript_47434/g.92570 Transcript_47434/m.92570 type:complete len:212 (+) Transcript_47434:604-1239(+)
MAPAARDRSVSLLLLSTMVLRAVSMAPDEYTTISQRAASLLAMFRRVPAALICGSPEDVRCLYSNFRNPGRSARWSWASVTADIFKIAAEIFFQVSSCLTLEASISVSMMSGCVARVSRLSSSRARTEIAPIAYTLASGEMLQSMTSTSVFRRSTFPAMSFHISLSLQKVPRILVVVARMSSGECSFTTFPNMHMSQVASRSGMSCRPIVL